MAGGRTGQVFVEDFDVGVVSTMGGELIEITLDGEVVQDFAINVPGVTGPDEYNGLIPIIFINPEDVYQGGFIPNVTISRTGTTPAKERWMPGGHEYLVPASEAKMVEGSNGEIGPTLLEKKDWTPPYDIQYDIQLHARQQRAAQLMLKQIGAAVQSEGPGYGTIWVKDSEGDQRGYQAHIESIDDLSEIADISDRTLGNLLSVRVEGELDFFDPRLVKAATRIAAYIRAMGSGTVGAVAGGV